MLKIDRNAVRHRIRNGQRNKLARTAALLDQDLRASPATVYVVISEKCRVSKCAFERFVPCVNHRFLARMS